jgi:bacillithiol biosynthesis cysteine-adding enzyme BshC
VSSIFEAYLAGEGSAFFDGHYGNAADRLRSLARAARPLAPAVAAVIERQNGLLSPSPARDRNIAALRRGAACVVSGQQAGLFLGPLFTFYKAASAVVVARALAHEAGRQVVPVFWLQSEDHDLVEIAGCHVPCERDEPMALRLPAAADDRASVEHRRLPPEVDGCLALLRNELANLPHAAEHLARLEDSYRPGTGWSQAFAKVLAGLFAGEGLVLIDPRDPELASAAAAVHERALTCAEPIATALLERTAALEAAGFAAGVHVRHGAPLSFFHPKGAAGPRYRLVPNSSGFSEVGGDGVHTLAALLAVLAREPLCFSTSVLLRPILQDTLLPTAAFVGGPAEVSYFAQLAPLYAAYGLPMPLVVPRARLRLIEAKTARLLAKLQLDPDFLNRSEDELLVAARHSLSARLKPAALSEALLQPLAERLAELEPVVIAEAPEVASALGKTRHHIEEAIAKLTAKYEKALLHHDESLVADVRRLKQRLYPQDVPQERFYGIAYFAARYGEDAFKRAVLRAISPFDGSPRDLLLSE